MTSSAVNLFMPENSLLGQLVEEAKARCAASFERIVMLHERQVLRFAQRLLLNREAARDAAQEVFIRLHKKIDAISVTEDRGLTPWLYRTTSNVCLDLLRRERHGFYQGDVPDVTDVALNPEQAAAATQQKQLVIEALNELSLRERQTIVLRDLEGLTTAEVAQILGSTETTVRSQISTGRTKMKNYVIARLEKRT